MKYENELMSCREIFVDRNRLYRGSFRRHGVYGAMMQLGGEIDKLQTLVESLVLSLDPREETRTKITDSLRDIVNYGLIGLIVAREDNYSGNSRSTSSQPSDSPSS